MLDIEMDLNHKLSIIRRYITAYNTFDVDGMLGVLSNKVNFQNVQNGEVTAQTNGIDEFEQLARQSIDLFSERSQTIERVEECDNFTRLYVKYYGKIAEDLPNGMSAGEVIQLQGISEIEFTGERIASIRDVSGHTAHS